MPSELPKNFNSTSFDTYIISLSTKCIDLINNIQIKALDNKKDGSSLSEADPGLEPGRPYGQGILSPLRLPIPPSGLLLIMFICFQLLKNNIPLLLTNITKFFLHFYLSFNICASKNYISSNFRWYKKWITSYIYLFKLFIYFNQNFSYISFRFIQL